jgi:hypothetical protein
MPSTPGLIIPRLERAEPVPTSTPTAGQTSITLPSARPWSFLLEAAVNLRSTVVSPPFTGPGMVFEIMYRQAGGATNIGGWALIWAADNGGAQTNGPMTPPPTGTPIFHPASQAGGPQDFDQIPEHIIQVATGTDPTAPVVIRPRFVVNTPDRWFLKSTIRGPTAAGTFHVRGVITVVEASSMEELRNFL